MSFRRLSAWSGIVFVILALISTFAALETPPTLSDSSQDIIDFYSKNHDSLLFGNYVSSIAGIFFILFIVGLWDRLRDKERAGGEPWSVVGLIGAIFLGVTATIGQTGATVAILRAETGSGAAAAWNDLSASGYALAGVFFALTAVAFSIALERATVTQPWVAWLGYLVGLLGLVGVTSAGTTTEWVGFVNFLAFLTFLGWTVVVALQTMGAEKEPPAIPAPPS